MTITLTAKGGANMNRRSFFGRLRDGISGSFLLGCSGGLVTGGMGVAVALDSPRAQAAARSYSQQGEDLIVDSICRSLAIASPTYLDVGAADPTFSSNTYLFYCRGCRGVLVEPNPAFCREIRRVRPGDVLLEVGIGVTDQEAADYYMIAGPGGEVLNTFSPEQVKAIVARSQGRRLVERVVRMPLLNINRVIADHFGGAAPDFLSIDIEGMDHDVLKSLDFDRFRPKVICVETLRIGTTKVETGIIDLMISKGYDARGSTFVNTIFVDRRLLEPAGG